MKIIIYSYTIKLLLGRLTKLPVYFENMLQLRRFGLYYESIQNSKWLLSYRNNDISYRDARVFGGMFPEKILK